MPSMECMKHFREVHVPIHPTSFSLVKLKQTRRKYGHFCIRFSSPNELSDLLAENHDMNPNPGNRYWAISNLFCGWVNRNSWLVFRSSAVLPNQLIIIYGSFIISINWWEQAKIHISFINLSELDVVIILHGFQIFVFDLVVTLWLSNSPA